MNQIKLVVSDIDGTLVRRGEPFPEAVAEVVQELKKRGIAFTFATGRLPYMILPYLEKLGLNVPYCACNGTLIGRGTKRLESHPLPVLPLRPLLAAACEMEMTVLYAVGGVEYCMMENGTVRKKRRERGQYHEIRPIQEEEWSSLLADKVNILDERGRVPELSGLESCLAQDCDITHYGNGGLEIVVSGYGKEYGLGCLARCMGITTDEILAIGDNENDIAMLLLAGTGGVVANGTEAAKACADLVSEAESGEGAAEIIRRVCLK